MLARWHRCRAKHRARFLLNLECREATSRPGHRRRSLLFWRGEEGCQGQPCQEVRSDPPSDVTVVWWWWWWWLWRWCLVVASACAHVDVDVCVHVYACVPLCLWGYA